MNDKKIGIGIFIAAILVVSVFGAMTPTASAVCNNGSVNVAFVPNPLGGGGGTLPTTHSDFSKFTFTNVPIASVNATTLANYDTVVMTVCDPMNALTPSNLTDIVNWIAAGGKLIIYDSECKWNDTIDYSWLPCNATTFCPGAWGATQVSYPWVNLTIVENNTLSDNNPANLKFFINTTKIARQTDAVGDQNVFIANDTCWCGDMLGTNVLNATGSPAAPGTTGFSHAYTNNTIMAQRGIKGLIIYNGLDIDPLSAGSDPTADTGRGHFAKIWFLELNQTWDNVTGEDPCGLPCGAPITPTPTPTPTPPPAPVPAITPIGIIALASLLSIVAAISISIRKKRR